MENINTLLIEDGLSQPNRLIKLNKIAIHQMAILVNSLIFSYQCSTYYCILRKEKRQQMLSSFGIAIVKYLGK